MHVLGNVSAMSWMPNLQPLKGRPGQATIVLKKLAQTTVQNMEDVKTMERAHAISIGVAQTVQLLPAPLNAPFMVRATKISRLENQAASVTVVSKVRIVVKCSVLTIAMRMVRA